MDEMDLDEEIDQERRRRAADKLNKTTGESAQHAKDVTRPALTDVQAKMLMRSLSEMLFGNKITPHNAFDLQGIDALKVLVFGEDARANARTGEGHFQNAGMGLAIGTQIYEKRVDALHRLAFRNFAEDARQDDDQEAGDTGGQRLGGKEGDEDNDAGATEEGGTAASRGGKGKKRHTADTSSTLVDDKALVQQVKEWTFDMDPFFVRTSRLIDENSPQGLLLRHLAVLTSGNIAFDPDARLMEVPDETQPTGDVPELLTDGPLLDLSCLPSMRGLRDAAAAALPISPGIDELYTMLKNPDDELPGLQITAKIDPEELLRTVLAENKRERVEAHRNAVVRQVVQQVEDAMDIDVAQAAGPDHQPQPNDDDVNDGQGYRDCGQGEDDILDYEDGGGDAFAGDGSYEDGVVGAGPSGANASGPPEGGVLNDAGNVRVGRWLGASDDDGEKLRGGSDREVGGSGGEDLGDRRSPSDDESAMLSLLSGFAASSHGGPGASQSSWWKSRTKRKPPGGAGAAAKPRARRQKADEAPLDWRAEPREPQLEDASLHTFKTTKREATAKLCLPPEEPARPEDLRAFFSTAPLYGPGDSFFAPACGSDAWRGAFHLEESWKVTLLADRARERKLRREMRAATAGQHANGQGAAAMAMGGTPFGWPAGANGPAMSGTRADDGHGGNMDGRDFGGEYGSGSGDGEAGAYDNYGDGGYDDAGAMGFGSITDDDDDEEQPRYANARGPTLEELLQPPRRFQRTAIKFDRTAGVADVASLKTNMEQSLKLLTANAQLEDPQPSVNGTASQPPPLSFQHVLDEVAHQAAERVASQQGANEKACNVRVETKCARLGRLLDPLAGVSTHLAFICLLHLANEKGLALSNRGDLDTLVISGLENLAREGHVGR